MRRLSQIIGSTKAPFLYSECPALLASVAPTHSLV